MIETKIEGPYRHGAGWRCRLRTGSRKRWCRAADTESEARQIAEADLTRSDPARPEPSGDPKPATVMPGPIRLDGPHPHGSGFRFRVTMGAVRSWCPAGRSERHARQIAEKVAEMAIRAGRVGIRDAIGSYLAYQEQKGNRSSTVSSYRYALNRFFAPAIDQEMGWLTQHRAGDLYEKIRSGGLATDSHRNYLLQSRTFLGWCVERGWIRSNPLEKVKPIGKRRHGKGQLTIDEARSLYRTCLKEAGRDDGALAVLIALLMGLRAGEIVSRSVRDLDDRGRILRVCPNEAIGFEPKTNKSKRSVPVPSDLQPLLITRTRHKLPGALLFPSETGGPHWRDWVSEKTRSYCKLAGVPTVCAHSLRGVAATASAQAGVAAEAVAQLLGHESPGMTRRSYIQPGTLEQAELSRTAETLAR